MYMYVTISVQEHDNNAQIERILLAIWAVFVQNFFEWRRSLFVKLNIDLIKMALAGNKMSTMKEEKKGEFFLNTLKYKLSSLQ